LSLADAASVRIADVKINIIVIRKTIGARVPKGVPVRFMTPPWNVASNAEIVCTYTI
jgi:hypothetical protein